MDASDILPPHFDLTGRVSVSGYLPDFTGNYSCVYKGLLRGDTVSFTIETHLLIVQRILSVGCYQDYQSK